MTMRWEFLAVAGLALAMQTARADTEVTWVPDDARRPVCSLVGDEGDRVRSVEVLDLDGDGVLDLAAGAAERPPPDCTSDSCDAGLVYLVRGPIPATWIGDVLLSEVATERWVPEVDEARAGLRLVALPRTGGDLLGVSTPRRWVQGAEDAGGFHLITSDLQGGTHSLDTGSVGQLLLASPDAVVGRWLAAGALDGDGVSDLVVTASGEGAAGVAWLFGSSGPGCDLAGDLDPATCPPLATIVGEVGELGRVVEVVPDRSGDGIDEVMIVDQTGGDPESLSRTYLFHGRSGPEWCPGDPCPTYTASDADVVFIEPRPARVAGESRVRVADLGDLDGDGLSELGFSSQQGRCVDEEDPCKSDGVLRILFGAPGPLPHEVVLGDASGGLDWLELHGPGNDSGFGSDLVALGDFDGDGHADIGVGAPEANDNDGRVYFVGGPLLPSEEPVSAPAVAWLTLEAGSNSERLGMQMTSLQDMDGDGWDDLLIAERGFRLVGGTPRRGRILIVFGGPLGQLDADADGWFAPGRCMQTEPDCDDADPTIRPDVDESAAAARNCRDDNCDGVVDEGQLGLDSDDDGFCEGEPDGAGGLVCARAGVLPGDCDDCDGALHPGAPEGDAVGGGLVPNGIDDDCDGHVDEGTLGVDDDGDGFCEGVTGGQGCIDGSVPGDCDDSDAARYPGAPEEIDRIDNDCDGFTDDTALGCCAGDGPSVGLLLVLGLLPLSRPRGKRRRSSGGGVALGRPR